MKKIYNLVMTSMIFSCIQLTAQVEIQDLGPTPMVPVQESSGSPFKIDISGDYVWEAQVNDEPGKVTFGTGMAEFNFVFYHQACYKEGAALAIEYERTYLNWSANPYFDQQNYDTISFLLSTFTERLNNWQWRAQIGVNFDNIPNWNASNYMYYDLLAWGRYAYKCDLGLHIGFLAQTGMKFDRVYPVIGLDWTFNEQWKFNVIFPVDISAVYTINKSWNIALAGRFLDQRHRAKKDESLTKAIWHYQTGGVELAANYLPTDNISANIHGGYNLGGHLTISDQHYHRYARLRVDGAPYAGAEIAVHF